MVETVVLHPSQGTMKTPQNLAECTVTTPPELVDFCWTIVQRFRPNTAQLRVVDLGAGDGRFAKPGYYRTYDGYDIVVTPQKNLAPKARLIQRCASTIEGRYGICIGNPPYLRHHAIDPGWRDEQRARLRDELGINVSSLANLYLYFIFYALRATAADGLVALLVPFDWYSRPSARAVRDHLEDENYAVEVFRIGDERRHFPKVYTTLSLLVIDRRGPFKGIQIHEAEVDGTRPTTTPVNASRFKEKLLGFQRLNRNGLHAFRGFSPGDQRVFTLTEAERREWNIPLSDVVPCLTSLRPLPADLARLNEASFTKWIVERGYRCWLLKTTNPSKPVMAWLEAGKHHIETNFTCQARDVWYQYNLPPVPDVVYSSAFRSQPKIILNTVAARVLGSVQGIRLGDSGISATTVRNHIASLDFSKRVVPLAKGMRKLEVGQMNSILAELASQPTHVTKAAIKKSRTRGAARSRQRRAHAR